VTYHVVIAFDRDAEGDLKPGEAREVLSPIVAERRARALALEHAGALALVNELHKALVPPRGLIASGKFEQYKRDIQKQRIIAGIFAPGASVAGVARRYSLNSNRLCHSNETRSTNGMACRGPVRQSLSREAAPLDQRDGRGRLIRASEEGIRFRTRLMARRRSRNSCIPTKTPNRNIHWLRPSGLAFPACLRPHSRR
jgi:transposase-like protein